jgi:hypothetical protein
MNEMPAFRVKFMTGNGQPISPNCGQYNIYSGQNGVGFQTYNIDATNSVSYRNWSMASVDLTPFIGQNIAIEFTTNDCSLGGHYGYAYIDMTCIAPTLSTDYCTGSPTAVVTAPDGYNAYSWTANDTIHYPVSSSNT